MKKLVSIGGQGYSYSTEIGEYKVKYGEREEKIFTRLWEARNYYENIIGEKAIWDVTKIPELLDCHSYVESPE